MANKACKIIILIIMLLNIFSIVNNNYASNNNQGVITQTSLFGNIKQAADDFLKTGKSNQKIDAATAKSKLLPIASMLVGIATVVFLITGGILGIQYMLKGADERAQLKQKLIWFVIAIVVVYGSAGIFNIAVNIMTKITGEA